MPQVCVHLEQSTAPDYAQWFSGDGVDYALICLACRDNPGAIEGSLKTVSPERFAELERSGCWDCDKTAIVGRPEVFTRPTGLKFEHRDITLPGMIPGAVAALSPIPNSERGECLALAESGALFRIDPDRGSVRRLVGIFDSETTLSPKWSLHASPDGEMAAVVEARGRYGVVLDLEVGRPTMRLDRGDYHFEHSEFPAAFFVTGGQLRLIHGTDWNRLDVSDPTTGRSLTDRSPTTYRQGEDEPEHYLDYFHGGLAVSPGGSWVADNGWAWHPAGVVTSWSLRRWVEQNRWESEDGPSKRDLCVRAYYWDGPLCWVDDHTVAVWGYGNDDENLIPAALLFNAETGNRLRWFAGPLGSFVCDRYLFSSSAEAGTSVWDLATGERLLEDRSFNPTAYHRGAKQFVTALPDGRFRLSRLAVVTFIDS